LEALDVDDEDEDALCGPPNCVLSPILEALDEDERDDVVAAVGGVAVEGAGLEEPVARESTFCRSCECLSFA